MELLQRKHSDSQSSRAVAMEVVEGVLGEVAKLGGSDAFDCFLSFPFFSPSLTYAARQQLDDNIIPHIHHNAR